MKIKFVQKFFRRVAEIQLKYRFVFLLALAVFSVVGIMGLKHFKSTSDEGEWLIKDAEYAKKNARFEELFGNNEIIALLIESDDVFQYEVLKVIKEIGKELLDNVPYADSLMSITDIDITVGTEEGMEIYHPFEDGVPNNKEEIEKFKRLIMSRKSLVNKIVSEDCKESWLILNLKSFPPKESLKENEKETLFVVGEKAMEIVTNPKWKSDKYTIKPIGTPYTETEEKVAMKQESMKTIGLSLIVMLILLIVFSMSFVGTIVPFIASGAGIASVFGYMSYFGISADGNMMTLPILLAMALSIGYSIHLLNSFKHYFYISGKRKEAVIQSIEETGWPLLFTVITTVVSVLSFLTTSLTPIRWGGAISACTVLAVYFYTATLIPIIMSFGKDRKPIPEHLREKKMFHTMDEHFANFGEKVIKKRIPILITFIIIFIACIPGLMKTEVKMKIFTFGGIRIPYLKRVYEITQSQLGSYLTYNVMITFPEDDAIKNPDVLKRVEKLENVISSFEATKKNKDVPKIFSITNIVKEMNQTLNGDNPHFYKLPEDSGQLNEMLFLYEMSGGDASKWVDDEYRTLRIRTEVVEFDSKQLGDSVNKLRQETKKIFPDADIFLVGRAVDFAEINEHIVFGELYSFLSSMISIAILMALVFGSIRLGLVGLIPNVAPLIVIGAIMGYAGIPLDMMTMTIMPMMLGIAVDDTIYFMTHAKLEFEEGGSYDLAVINTFRTIGKTLGATTVILCSSFASYSISLLDGIARLGVLAAIGLFVALLADYLMTPILIYMLKPFKR
ncbi:MAG: efflux RND transporter permease subunit [Treponema sp.]